MEKLKFTFMGNSHKSKKITPIEEILHRYGQEICDYAKGYFNYIVTTTSVYENVTEASLYVIVPEIGYDYKVLSISYIDTEYVNVNFFTLKTNQTESKRASIKNGFDEVSNEITSLLNNSLANQTFKFLVDQVDMKRESREEND